MNYNGEWCNGFCTMRDIPVNLTLNESKQVVCPVCGVLDTKAKQFDHFLTDFGMPPTVDKNKGGRGEISPP